MVKRGAKREGGHGRGEEKVDGEVEIVACHNRSYRRREGEERGEEEGVRWGSKRKGVKEVCIEMHLSGGRGNSFRSGNENFLRGKSKFLPRWDSKKNITIHDSREDGKRVGRKEGREKGKGTHINVSLMDSLIE